MESHSITRVHFAHRATRSYRNGIITLEPYRAFFRIYTLKGCREGKQELDPQFRALGHLA